MPLRNGFEATSDIRKYENENEKPHTYICGLSALIDDSNIFLHSFFK
jgi:hypothetical protein